MAETRSQMLFTETVVRETMAETRSQAVVTEETIGSRIQALEDLVKERNQKIDRNISDMLEAMNLLTNKGYSSHVQDLRNSSRVSPAPANSPSDPAHGHRSGISNSYVGVTRLAKLDCPRFGGDRVKEWLFKIEQFFLVDRTPDELKIGLASGLFDDLAATWHQWILQSVLWEHVRHDWVTYKLLLQGRFNEMSIEQCLMLGRLYEKAQNHWKRLTIKTDGDDYPKEAQPLNVQSDAARPSLSNFQVHNSSHEDKESSDGKTAIQQKIYVEVESLLQQQELICEQAHPQNVVTTRVFHKLTSHQDNEFSVRKQSIQQESYVGVKKLLQQQEVICGTKSIEILAMVQQKKPKEIFLKCWKFKFKTEKEDIQQQHNQIFHVFNCGNNIGFDHHEKELHFFDGVVVKVSFQHSTGLSRRLQGKKKQKKCPKSWMFKYRAPLKRVQFLHSFSMEVHLGTTYVPLQIRHLLYKPCGQGFLEGEDLI
ncbi:unnamed protein product [Arabidopsis halleri]